MFCLIGRVLLVAVAITSLYFIILYLHLQADLQNFVRNRLAFSHCELEMWNLSFWILFVFFIEFYCALVSFVLVLGALPVHPVDRINEIEDEMDYLDAIEKIPGEAKFYRTSTERYDDFVPPQVDISDEEINGKETSAMNHTVSVVVAQQGEPNIELPVPQDVDHDMESTEPSVIDGPQFLELLNFFAEAGRHMVQETKGSEPKADEDANNRAELITELAVSDETTISSDTIGNGTTELYAPRTLKRPIISQTVKDVLHAFKVLHNWRFTK